MRCKSILLTAQPSVRTESARRAASSFPTKVRSEVTVSYKPPDLSSLSDETDSEDEEDETTPQVRVPEPAKTKVRREYFVSYPKVWGGLFMHEQRTALIRQRPDTGTNRGSQPEERWELR